MCHFKKWYEPQIAVFINHIGTQPCLSIYRSSLAAFRLWQENLNSHNWHWPGKPKTCTIWPLTEEVCQLMLCGVPRNFWHFHPGQAIFGNIHQSNNQANCPSTSQLLNLNLWMQSLCLVYQCQYIWPEPLCNPSTWRTSLKTHFHTYVPVFSWYRLANGNWRLFWYFITPPHGSYFDLILWVLWRRQWHPTPVLLPGKSHGWRSLVGCSPWGR